MNLVLAHYGDLTDSTNLIRIIQSADETHNPAQVMWLSFESPEYTANCDALGTYGSVKLRILGLTENTRVYQASVWLGDGSGNSSEGRTLLPA